MEPLRLAQLPLTVRRSLRSLQLAESILKVLPRLPPSSSASAVVGVVGNTTAETDSAAINNARAVVPQRTFKCRHNAGMFFLILILLGFTTTWIYNLCTIQPDRYYFFSITTSGLAHVSQNEDMP
jgi:hypothetical protein